MPRSYVPTIISMQRSVALRSAFERSELWYSWIAFSFKTLLVSAVLHIVRTHCRFVFRSLEPKAQVSFSDHIYFVCCSSSSSKTFHKLASTTGSISIKHNTKHTWLKDTHVSPNERPRPFPRKVKIYWRNLKILSRTTGHPLDEVASSWVKWWTRHFPMVNYNEIVKILKRIFF